ncbi:MAG: GNAT family N-acetyltransferase [Clostridia bacterium]|nr:GNAT family N-acetyltransferase [Clostridia bacterium]
MTIRPYEAKDFEDVRFVCLNSEGPCDMDEAGRHYILTTYCDYYLEKEPQNCFVAADENDRAIGYVICAENYGAYRPVFLKEYVPRIPAKQLMHRIAARGSTILQNKYKKTYPAHLHIDVLPEYQRQGLGHKMVDALCAHLKEKGVRGVMLTVGTGNNVGRSFYEKYGFTFLETLGGDTAYGIRL